MRPSRTSRMELVRALRLSGARQFKGNSLCCPFHFDRNPSASIFVGKDGHWRFKCHGCNIVGDVWDVSARAERTTLQDWLYHNPEHAADTDTMTITNDAMNTTSGTNSSEDPPDSSCRATSTHPPGRHHASAAPAPLPTSVRQNEQLHVNITPAIKHAIKHAIMPATQSHDNARIWATREQAQADLAHSAGGTLEACYDYVDRTGAQPVMVVLRISLPHQRPNGKPEKTFRQISPLGTGWAAKAPPAPWPLYRLPEILNASTVVLVEGEKACDALWGVGIPATTSPGGALRASQCDLTPLDGKHVILWPDHDDKGHQHMAEVQRLLNDLARPPRITLVDPNAMPIEMPRKGDAVEFIDAIAGDAATRRRAILAMFRSMSGTGSIDDLQIRLDDQFLGRFVALPLPWPMLHTASQALLPGSVTLLCGGPGAAKSFMALHIALHAHRNGIPVAVLELEETHAFYQQRILAMLAKSSSLMRPDLVRAQAEQVRRILDQHRGELESFNPHLFVIPSMRLADIMVWIETQCRAGHRLILVDPITVADSGGLKPWEADALLMRSITPVLNRYGAALILVTHPSKVTSSKAGAAPNLSDLAGGAAYQRMAQCILWLHNADQTEGMVETERNGSVCASFNRRVMVLKARNGAGNSQRFAFTFRGDDFQFIEVGRLLNPVRANTAANKTPLGPLPLAPPAPRHPDGVDGLAGSSPGRTTADPPVVQQPSAMRDDSSWSTPLSSITAFADSLMTARTPSTLGTSPGTTQPETGRSVSRQPDRPSAPGPQHNRIAP